MKPNFNLASVLHELKHYLPSQTPLKDFIHHNSLHAFQHQDFFSAIFNGSEIFGFQPTLQLSEYRNLYQIGRIKEHIIDRVLYDHCATNSIVATKENMLHGNFIHVCVPRIGRLRKLWKEKNGIDLDDRVHPFLFRVTAAYIDQGIASWKFPETSESFLSNLRKMELNSSVSFFSTPQAKQLLLDEQCKLEDLLQMIVGDERYFEQYLFDQQFAHRGWSGMVATIESKPETLLLPRKISLSDFIHFELLLEIDRLNTIKKNWKPLIHSVTEPPLDIFGTVEKTEVHQLLEYWQLAFEWSYYDEVLQGISSANRNESDKTPSFQAVFCIDERECSLRRHLENADKQCATLGTPGFFGVEFYYLAHGAAHYDKLCPAPVTPKYLIKENIDAPEKKHSEFFYSPVLNGLIGGFLHTITLGYLSGISMLQKLFRPKMSPAISDAFAHMSKLGTLSIENKGETENNLQVGFTVNEMADRVFNLLSSIGLTRNFSPLVYFVAHGSSSANNPHHGAHDCGACSGRPGSVNARVAAFMANHTEVRKELHRRGLTIPASTIFVGSLHDTAADQIDYYDNQHLDDSHLAQHLINKKSFEQALDDNAQERSRRFYSINTKSSIKKIRKAIAKRSVSLFEPRPELGHGTNTLCIIGNRSLTRNIFLDRRAFMNSYDHQTDPDGTLLKNIMRPIGPVCGGINLEYYFSRVDNEKMGAGTKLPHHVMGLFGVTNSYDGDLRPGLPWQMIEVHDPVRLMVIVEQSPELLLTIIQSDKAMYEWYINEWVHLVALDPESGNLYYFTNDSFVPYTAIAEKPSTISNWKNFVENAKEMETNRIEHATTENLPVHLLNQ